MGWRVQRAAASKQGTKVSRPVAPSGQWLSGQSGSLIDCGSRVRFLSDAKKGWAPHSPCTKSKQENTETRSAGAEVRNEGPVRTRISLGTVAGPFMIAFSVDLRFVCLRGWLPLGQSSPAAKQQQTGTERNPKIRIFSEPSVGAGAPPDLHPSHPPLHTHTHTHTQTQVPGSPAYWAVVPRVLGVRRRGLGMDREGHAVKLLVRCSSSPACTARSRARSAGPCTARS